MPILNDEDHKVQSYTKEEIDFFPTIGIKLTGKCRHSCPFCCEPDRQQNDAPLEAMYLILDTIKKAGTKRLCFTGGEPLLYPHIKSVLHHAHELGFYNLLLTTDGELLIKHLDDIGSLVSAVRFSVHGLNAHHDSVVNFNDSFKNIETACKILATKNIESNATTVVTNENVFTLDDIAEWCVDTGIKKWFLFGLLQSGLGAAYQKEHGIVKGEDIRAKADCIRKQCGDQLELIVYEYENSAECILIYGDGRVVIDPSFSSGDNCQEVIGNILNESPHVIMAKFNSSSDNISGYGNHLCKLGLK